MKKSDLVIIDKVVALEKENLLLSKIITDLHEYLDEEEREALGYDWKHCISSVDVPIQKIRRIIKIDTDTDVLIAFQEKEAAWRKKVKEEEKEKKED